MFNQKTITVKKQKHTPGYVNMRFGDWRKNEPTVLIPAMMWAALGKPDKVKVIVSV